jgi:hypothetical protein
MSWFFHDGSFVDIGEIVDNHSIKGKIYNLAYNTHFWNAQNQKTGKG